MNDTSSQFVPAKNRRNSRGDLPVDSLKVSGDFIFVPFNRYATHGSAISASHIAALRRGFNVSTRNGAIDGVEGLLITRI